jgi:hypothetical protein
MEDFSMGHPIEIHRKERGSYILWRVGLFPKKVPLLEQNKTPSVKRGYSVAKWETTPYPWV